MNWLTSPHLMRAHVMHKRLLPRVHGFNYKVYYLALPIETIAQAGRGILSIEARNLLSFYHKDHGARDGSDSGAWARELLQRFNHHEGVSHIVLISLPRILGYVFNPVSFWLGFNTQGQLMAAIAEVNNTFKESHSYVLAMPGGAPIGPDDWITTSKDFHVSPFLPVEGSYKFRFAPKDDKLGIWIDHYNAEGELTLLTALTGSMQPVTRASLWKAFFAIPLVTIKVIGLIHFEALRLMAKKIKYRVKPPQKEHKVTKWS